MFIFPTYLNIIKKSRYSYLLSRHILVKSEPEKTYRDVDSSGRYDEKCKNNPVWQTYNRAYKVHYARYIKKKMTVAEFEQWLCFANELRDKAESNEISYELYYENIRK